MMHLHTFSSFSLFLCVVLCYILDSYADGPNFSSLKDNERPFRINKVNQLWQKAKKHIEGQKLADLFADLTAHDKLEGNLKKLKADDMDKDGMKEAGVQSKFITILDKYRLREKFPVDDKMANEIPNSVEHLKITDRRLQNVWDQADLSEFTAEELQDLKEEFWHHQMKIDEFDAFKNEVDLDSEFGNDLVKQKEWHNNNRELKNKHRDIRDNVNKLKEKLASVDDTEFEDHRVYELWALAKRANMSADELDSFKNELKHFERRLEKHDYMKEQLSQAEMIYEAQYKRGNYPEKHSILQIKVKDYERQAVKMHTDLKKTLDKAYNRHTEL